MSLESLISHYGWLAILIGSAVEGETVVFLGGVFSRREILSYGSVVAAAACGSFAADQLFFFLGRHARSYRRVERILQRPEFARIQRLLVRYPTLFILAFRFLYGLRIISPMAIGASNISAAKFVMLNALAAILWAVIISAAGYLAGAGIERIFGQLALHHHVLIALLCLAIVLVAGGGMAWLRLRKG